MRTVYYFKYNHFGVLYWLKPDFCFYGRKSANYGGKSANYGGKSARLFTHALQLPKERSYFLSDNFYFIYLFFNFARLIIGYSLFTLLPFFFVSFCQSKFFELAPLLPIVTLCMEIGFLISDHELNQIGRVWPWGWGAGPLHPYWWGVVFAWPGGQHHCWLGAWPGYSKFLLFIAQLPFVGLLFLNWLPDCSCINL